MTVHNERAQQLERLCYTNQTRQDPSWPLTPAEPEASKHPADGMPGHHAEIKAQLVFILHNNSQWIRPQKGVVFIHVWVICLNHRDLLSSILSSRDTRPLFWVLLCDLAEPPRSPLQHLAVYIYTMSASVDDQIFRYPSEDLWRLRSLSWGLRREPKVVWCGPSVVFWGLFPLPLPLSQLVTNNSSSCYGKKGNETNVEQSQGLGN